MPAAKASPASSAPPGRRMPNVTASASQNSPTSGGAVLLLAVKPKMLERSRRRTRRSPAASAKIMILMRLVAMPDASAATSELRTARMARPDAERWQRVDDQGDAARTREEQQDLLGDLAEVELAGWSPFIRTSLQPVQPRDVERRRADRPAELAVADRLVREGHEREEERPSPGSRCARNTPPRSRGRPAR